MFDKDSGLVKIWLKLLTEQPQHYTYDMVPDISNLRVIVALELFKD